MGITVSGAIIIGRIIVVVHIARGGSKVRREREMEKLDWKEPGAMPEMGAQQLQITTHGLGLLDYKAKLKWRDLLHQCVASDTVINLSSRHNSGPIQSNHSSVSVLINGFFDCREDGLGIHTHARRGRTDRTGFVCATTATHQFVSADLCSIRLTFILEGPTFPVVRVLLAVRAEQLFPLAVVHPHLDLTPRRMTATVVPSNGVTSFPHEFTQQTHRHGGRRVARAGQRASKRASALTGVMIQRCLHRRRRARIAHAPRGETSTPAASPATPPPVAAVGPTPPAAAGTPPRPRRPVSSVDAWTPPWER